MSAIRIARPDDLPALAAMRMAAFSINRFPNVDALAAYMRSVFFDNPWGTERAPSLVCEAPSGEIIGFLGVIARPMVFDAQPITSGVLSTFMVHRDHRGKGIGRELMDRYLNGAQDFSWSDIANTATRAVWHSLGGQTPLLHNLYWTRPLRPLRSASAKWTEGRVGLIARSAARPFSAIIDPLLVRLPGAPLQIPTPRGALEPLNPAALEKEAEVLLARYSVRPIYTGGTFAWLNDQLSARSRGAPERLVVRRDDGGLAGWFIYFANPRGTAEVVQIVAGENDVTLVLDHLVSQAWKSGSVTLMGRADPLLIPGMSSRGFTFTRENPWVLVHSRRPEIVDAIQSGDAFMSRLEGEWWMNA